jgi:hypothetical protein
VAGRDFSPVLALPLASGRCGASCRRFPHPQSKLSDGISECFSLPIYGRVERKYHVCEQIFVRFTNSNSFRLTEEHTRGAASEAVGRNSDQVQQELREELIVDRKEELDDLIAAFGRRIH